MTKDEIITAVNLAAMSRGIQKLPTEVGKASYIILEDREDNTNVMILDLQEKRVRFNDFLLLNLCEEDIQEKISKIYVIGCHGMEYLGEIFDGISTIKRECSIKDKKLVVDFSYADLDAVRTIIISFIDNLDIRFSKINHIYPVRVQFDNVWNSIIKLPEASLGVSDLISWAKMEFWGACILDLTNLKRDYTNAISRGIKALYTPDAGSRVLYIKVSRKCIKSDTLLEVKEGIVDSDDNTVTIRCAL